MKKQQEETQKQAALQEEQNKKAAQEALVAQQEEQKKKEAEAKSALETQKQFEKNYPIIAHKVGLGDVKFFWNKEYGEPINKENLTTYKEDYIQVLFGNDLANKIILEFENTNNKRRTEVGVLLLKRSFLPKDSFLDSEYNFLTAAYNKFFVYKSELLKKRIASSKGFATVLFKGDKDGIHTIIFSIGITDIDLKDAKKVEKLPIKDEEKKKEQKKETSKKTEKVTPSEPKEDLYFSSCKEAKAAGHYNLREGQPGYSSKLDRDGDGVACEK